MWHIAVIAHRATEAVRVCRHRQTALPTYVAGSAERFRRRDAWSGTTPSRDTSHTSRTVKCYKAAQIRSSPFFA